MSDDLLQRVRRHGAVPAHVAIIMDGNGRWAGRRRLPRPLGHHAGMTAVREVIEGSVDAGVRVLTLFAFSQENWQRPAAEIAALMSLLEEYIAREVRSLRERGVAVRVLGNLDRLPAGAMAANTRTIAPAIEPSRRLAACNRRSLCRLLSRRQRRCNRWPPCRDILNLAGRRGGS